MYTTIFSSSIILSAIFQANLHWPVSLLNNLLPLAREENRWDGRGFFSGQMPFLSLIQALEET